MKTALCILISMRLALPAGAMTVTPRGPGGVFVAGRQLVFDIADAKGSVNYTLTSYFGSTTAEGNASAGGLRIAGQKPGWYSLKCTDQAGSVTVPVGVVMDRGNKPLPANGRIGSDSASAWLVQNEAYRKPYARMLHLAGIPWVRERLSWPATEAAPGKIDWLQYQTVADTLSAEGIHISQIFHQAPDWAIAGGADYRLKDLRDIYRYIKTAAGHFRNQIQAWEIWNEIDIGFWTGLGDSFAGIQKAAYLGVKAGNPDALVLQSSLSHLAWTNPHDTAPWLTADHFYANGVGDYFDLFNWHSYLSPKDYSAELKGYTGLLQEHHCAPRPSWLTECGSPSTATEPPDHRVLTEEAQRSNCRFLPRSVIMGLASGTDKYFWFVMPDYMEGKNQFGLLRPDLAPYPGFLALSAAANILGQSEYIGEYKPEGQQVNTHLFKTPQGTILAAWSDNPVTLALPTSRSTVRVANIFGAVSRIAVKNGNADIKVGPEVVYVLDVDRSIISKVLGSAPPRESLPANHPSKTVLVGRCGLPVDRGGKSCYNLVIDGSTAKPFTYNVEVYRLDEAIGASGTVQVIAPSGWIVEQPKRAVKLSPMGREVMEFKVTPMAGGGEHRISAWGKFGSPAVSPTVSRIR